MKEKEVPAEDTTLEDPGPNEQNPSAGVQVALPSHPSTDGGFAHFVGSHIGSALHNQSHSRTAGRMQFTTHQTQSFDRFTLDKIIETNRNKDIR